MQPTILIPLAAFAAFVLSWAIYPVIYRYAQAKNIVDIPNGRKLQKQPVPLLGGVVIALAMIFPTLIFDLYATEGTAKYLVENGVPAERVIWPTEAKDPDLAGKYKAAMDMLANKELDLVINIPKNFSTGELSNGYYVRRAAIDYNIPLITNARLATAFIRAFCAMSIDDIQIKSWDQS